MRRGPCVGLVVALALWNAGAPASGNGPASPSGKDQSAASSKASRDTVSEGASPFQVFLAWNAPYATPGARDNIQVACGDTARRDTLYVSFDPGRDYQTFYGMSVTLSFHAAPGDTLGPLWWFGGGESNPRNVRILFPVVPGWPCPGPWKTQGMSLPNYGRTSQGGMLDVMYAVSSDSAKALSKGRYCFARIVFPRPTRDLANCDQPICIECVQSEIGYQIGAKAAGLGAGGHRLVSWNSPGGKVCEPFRGARRVAPWQPNTRRGEPAADTSSSSR